MSQRYRIYCITEGANIYIVTNTAPSTCPNNVAHTVNTSSVSEIENFVLGPTLYGDGSDGDFVVGETQLLSRDSYYRNVRIFDGASINTGGYRLFVADTLTIEDGWVECNGANASGQTPGVAGTVGTLGSGSAGGTGGNSGAAGGAAGNLTATTRLGGTGGAGGNSTGSGGATGTGTVPTAAMGGTQILRTHDTITGRSLTGLKLNGGLGGGGGGGGTAPFVGGGGGAGGGVCIVNARKIVVTTGGFRANGGNGANASGATGGGGGAGGGGCVVVVTTSDMAGVTIQALSGTPGAGGSNPGASGAVGNTFTVVV